MRIHIQQVQGYKYGGILGKGGNAVVIEAFRKQKQYAIKVMSKQYSIFCEIQCIKKLCKYPNLIKVYQLFHDQNKYHMIMKKCQSNLWQWVVLQNINQDRAIKYLKDIIKSYVSIRLCRIIHLDIKPENIFIQKQKGKQEQKQVVAKIGDYGNCIRQRYKDPVLQKITGTCYYMAPQLYIHDSDYYTIRKPITHKADIWSIGMTFYKILFSKFPWKEQNSNNLQIIYSQIKQNKQIQIAGVSQSCKDFILRCLKVDPKSRMSLQQIIYHKLFKGSLQKQIPKQFLTVLKYQNHYKKLNDEIIKLQQNTVLDKQNLKKILSNVSPVDERQCLLIINSFGNQQNKTITVQQLKLALIDYQKLVDWKPQVKSHIVELNY